MKKRYNLIVIIILGIFLISCNKIDNNNNNGDDNNDPIVKEVSAIVLEEEERAFRYFMATTNLDKNSNGYGLVRDRYPNNPNMASIAAVGFSLASLPIGVENKWIPYEEAFEIANLTMDTLLRIDRINGFYYHFININSGQRSPGSEISIIDTGLLLAGAIVAGEYFKGSVKDKVLEIYEDINWNWYVNPSKMMFYMGYQPQGGFSGAWDHVSEQLILYVLAAGAPIHSTGDKLYKKMQEVSKIYKGTYISSSNPDLSVNTPFIYTYNGSLFQYQFSHAFVDFRNLVDDEGTNWFDNSVLATKAAYAYAQDRSSIYKTYGENSFGITASDGPGEYKAYGSKPAKNNTDNGTIAPYGAIASINYMPKEAMNAAYHYASIDGLFSEYGFKDSFNQGRVDNEKLWVAKDYIGIDKGITILMIENYRTNLIWELFMKNENVITGLHSLGFVKGDK